ncbi:MAG: dihydropteroate synthase [Chloroflexota bacterium]|nr:dihydropteroate synthase [Chloroflexota bacterium]
MTMLLQGTGEPLVIDPAGPTRIIGERINPSGKSALRRALQDGDWDYVVREAQGQAAAGADVIDVNVGGKGIVEASVLPDAVRVVSGAVDVPLSIDTRIPAALEAALAVCPGRPLVNSIGGEKKILAENLPIVAEYGVPVIVLCMGQDGIPSTADERLKIANQVLEAAVQAGVKQEDVIFDPLVMTVGADDQAARVVLETVRRLRAEFPANSITGGASNVSFGMPARLTLNANFLAVAAVLGLNVPVTDPTRPELRFALLSADIFLGRDRRTRRYMKYYRSTRQER